MRLLVTGGAGYIGSVVAAHLLADGHGVVVLLCADGRWLGERHTEETDLGACEPGRHVVYNLGSATGFTNREVVAACREVTGRPLPVKVADRRAGDPAVLVASHERIAGDLGWRPERGLSVMVADAWAFTRSQAA